MPNRLAQETSPYLRQHQDNPVDWYPWGPEALERAKREDKPIHLSVGYSACHWCHVMAHESFENAEIAQSMNERFINIKVDREERPDLDQIYQNVAQVFTHSGGWPLTVFLTPELKPFFGGTYFPAEDKYGRPGFQRVVKALSDAYKNERGAVAENAEKADRRHPFDGGRRRSRCGTAELSVLQDAGKSLLMNVDWTHGGLGSAPKFPNSMTFSYLWRLGTRSASKGHARRRYSHSPGWRRVEFTITWAAGFPVTRWMSAGRCPTSRRCFTTTACYLSSMPKYCFRTVRSL